tara:strand:- start:1157 stop:1897 length:741 start_codon:yes stop_codon:yes gene_type:complete
MTSGLLKTSNLASKAPSAKSSGDEGKVVQLDATGGVPSYFVDELSFSTLGLLEKSADPANPANGAATLWLSDGTGAGADGDVLIKVTTGLATASYADAVDYNGFTINDSYTITVSGTAYTVITEGVDATGSASTTSTAIAIGCSSGPSAGTLAETVVDAINGKFGSGGTYNHGFASANTGVNTGVPGVTATLSGSTEVTLTADTGGVAGNSIAVANVVGNAATNGSLSGGVDAVTKTATLVDYSAV